MLLKSIRKVCMIGLPVLLVIASVLHFCTEQSDWYQSIYTIILTANIGYFTNYVAIKMLFKPHYKTVFGRQGLIPKNQNKLADNLSETLIDNFLSKQQWQEYLTNSDLVNKVLADAKQTTRIWLTQPDNIEAVVQLLTEYLKQHETVINQTVVSLQQQLINELSSQIDSEELLAKGFGWLATQFDENPEQMQMMIEPIIKTVAENIPEIAHSLVKTLDSHIEEQDTIKRGIAKMARWSADFSVDDIKHYLFRMVASFEFRETLFEGLKTLLIEYQDRSILTPESSGFNNTQQDKTDAQVSVSLLVSKMIRTNLTSINWVKLMINKLSTANNHSGSKDSIDFSQLLLSAHEILFIKIDKELANGATHTWIIEQLVSMIDKLNLRQMVKNKAAAFAPQKMESLFQKMISEQLVFIELLGAVLGALSGLALIDIRIFGLLASVLTGYYLTDSFLTARKNLS